MEREKYDHMPRAHLCPWMTASGFSISLFLFCFGFFFFREQEERKCVDGCLYRKCGEIGGACEVWKDVVSRVTVRESRVMGNAGGAM